MSSESKDFVGAADPSVQQEPAIVAADGALSDEALEAVDGGAIHGGRLRMTLDTSEYDPQNAPGGITSFSSFTKL